MEGNADRVRGYIKNLCTAVFLICLSLSLLLLVFRQPVINYLGEGFTPGVVSLCMSLFVMILPVVVLYPFIAVGSAIHQVRGSFTIPALAPVLYNLVFLGAVMYGLFFGISGSQGAYISALSITAGVAAALALVWVSLHKHHTKASAVPVGKAVNQAGNNELSETFHLFSPYLLILVSIQIISWVERHIASQFGAGSVSGLNYAYRLSQFPVWVFVSAAAAVILPYMSRAVEDGGTDRLRAAFRKTLGMTLAAVLPISIFMYFLRVPLVSVLFMRGAFDMDSLAITSSVLSGYSAAIIGQSISAICLRFFLARRDMAYAAAVFIFSTLANIAADYCLTGFMGLPGLGWGALLGSLVSLALLAWLLKSRNEFEPGKTLVYVIKTAAANLPVLAVCFILNRAWVFLPYSDSPLHGLLYLGSASIVCCALYWPSLRHCKLI